MIVYVESNFILELAYLQEQHESCEGILILAEEGAIVLATPAFCLGEPYESYARRSQRRKGVRDQLDREIRELSRSRPYNTLSQESQEIIRVLIASGEHEKQRLDDIVGRVADAAAIIPMDRDVIRAAIRVGIDRGLSPQDAIVYASILAHMANAPGEARCFLTKNSRDFEDPDIQNDLLANNCKLLTKFRDGLGYIQSLLP